MTTIVLPKANAPAAEWGRLAMRIPGWRAPMEPAPGAWMPCLHLLVPEPDHWMWEGWLVRLLGSEAWRVQASVHEGALEGYEVYGDPEIEYHAYSTSGIHPHFEVLPLGRACIAAAEALGRWPGGVA